MLIVRLVVVMMKWGMMMMKFVIVVMQYMYVHSGIAVDGGDGCDTYVHTYFITANVVAQVSVPVVEIAFFPKFPMIKGRPPLNVVHFLGKMVPYTYRQALCV